MSLSNPNQLCPGDSLALFGAGGTSYSWSHNLSDGQAFVPQSTDSYTVTATDANGCSDTASIYVPLLTAPSPSIQATAMALCPNQSLSLTATGADTYSWDNGVVNGQSFVPDSSRRYTVTASLNNGCSDTAQVYIMVYPRPMVQANASAFSICQGEPLLLYGSGANSYSWDNNVADGQAFVLQTTTTFTLIATDANACQDTSQIELVARALPQLSILNLNSLYCSADNSIQLEASPANGLFSGPAVSPGDSILFDQLANGSYTVNYAYTDEFGCSNELNQSFDMDNCAGLTEADRWNQLKVYPNPSHNEVYIDLSDLEQQPLQLRLYNLMGQLVWQEEQMGGRLASLSMADLPAGTYILQLQQANEQIQLTVVKQ